MRKLKILHAADLHLDSPFEGLSAGKAAIRRSEQRELLGRLAELVFTEQADLVLLSGDLLDSDRTYYETGEELLRALKDMKVPVFISPGNHDYFSDSSPYSRLAFPENVHIFAKSAMSAVELPELSVRVYGAGFEDKYSASLLANFNAIRSEGIWNLLCIHGEFGMRESRYNPISAEQLAASGIDYAALGHIHKASGLMRAGDTYYSWPGCPEGRGFDETGEKFVNIIELSDSGCTLRPVSVAARRYEILRVSLGEADALGAIHAALPDDTAKDIYRIILTGETDSAPELQRLHTALDGQFFELQLRDETRPRLDIWKIDSDDTLRGIFVKKLRAAYDAAADDAARSKVEQALRWGLAALDNMEEVAKHENQ